MKRRETPKERLERMTLLERELWSRGYLCGGVDEVGRGALAGPVVTACVVLPPMPLLEGIDDSKRLTPARREAMDKLIRATAFDLATAMADEAEIGELNIRGATRLAMERAAGKAQMDYLLTDAEKDLDVPVGQRAIIHGDAVSYQIAAASIVAKVYRDKMMVKYARMYPEYGFERNKGYGTPEHVEALHAHGPCPIHRPLFLRGILGSR